VTEQLLAWRINTTTAVPARWLGWPVRATLLLLLAAYQRLVSPALPPCCRFVPSCSTYAREALSKHGLCLGLLKTAWRLARCHPLCRGGYDPP